MPTQEEVTVLEPGTGTRVPRDGATIGEIAIRGNTLSGRFEQVAELAWQQAEKARARRR